MKRTTALFFNFSFVNHENLEENVKTPGYLEPTRAISTDPIKINDDSCRVYFGVCVTEYSLKFGVRLVVQSIFPEF